MRCLALERDGSLPEGCRDWLLDGLLRLFGPWALLHPGPRLHGVWFVVCGFVRILLFFEKGGFPWPLGDPYGCPRQ
jgi:hypothetical protein